MSPDYCNRKDCKYWHSPGRETPNSCDYLMITGKSRIKEIPEKSLRRKWDACPVYEKGESRRRTPVMPFEIRPAYDWALAMKLYKAGALDGDIAAALGCSTAGVKWWRQKNNLPGQTRRRYE